MSSKSVLFFEEEFDQLEDVMFNAQYLLFANNVVVLPAALYNQFNFVLVTA